MHSPYFIRRAAASAALAFLALLAGGAAAQTPTGPSLKEVTVTGSPTGTGLVAPADSLSGPALMLRSQSTLGETLNNTPGVSSTYFGPNASRPVIRGLDGDRIRILGNGGASIDASSLSYDHAVTTDPLAIERIEVLRGPGALMYGSAVGGVVNVIDNRIPREPLFDDKGGVAGKLDLGLASVNREKGGGFLVEGGTDKYALHADVSRRSSGDVRVPILLPCTQGGVTGLARRICNSANEVQGGAFGGSMFFDRGYLGASVSSYRSNYGTVAEDEVTIGMRSTRYALEGQWKPRGLFESVTAKLSHTDYMHTEYDAGAPGTVFKNQGNDVRLEARHAKLGNLQGVVGLQSEATRFSADGSEAFAPYSRTAQSALFVFEELEARWGKLSFGARLEDVKVQSFGNPSLARFTPGSRSFTPKSYALGVLYKLAPQWQLTSNLSLTQRAPKDYELFADGPHVATGAYEVGDATLSAERSANVDAGVQWKSGAHSFKLSAFNNRFSNYIAQVATGNTRDAAGNGAGGVGVTDCGDGTSVQSGCTAQVLPELAYRQVRARFTGLEAGGTLRLREGPSTWDLELRGDLVRADNLTTGEPLPRIAPMRLGATLAWTEGPWTARLGFDRASAQDRVPAGQLAVAGYTLWNAAATYRMKAGPSTILWYARLDNIADALAYPATSILTQTAPGKVPLPGRNFKVGMQASF